MKREIAPIFWMATVYYFANLIKTLIRLMGLMMLNYILLGNI